MSHSSAVMPYAPDDAVRDLFLPAVIEREHSRRKGAHCTGSSLPLWSLFRRLPSHQTDDPVEQEVEAEVEARIDRVLQGDERTPHDGGVRSRETLRIGVSAQSPYPKPSLRSLP